MSSKCFCLPTTMVQFMSDFFFIHTHTLLSNIVFYADDWKSILGDPTKFAFGLITVGFEIAHFSQHYILYRGAWMRSYKLAKDCECAEPGCKHKKKAKAIHGIISLPENKIMLKRVEYYDNV